MSDEVIRVLHLVHRIEAGAEQLQSRVVLTYEPQSEF